MANAEHTSGAALVREAIDLLLKRLKRPGQLRTERADVCVALLGGQRKIPAVLSQVATSR
jgi:hypothetical protein